MPTMNVGEKVVFSSYEINCTLYPPLFFFLFYLFLVKGMTISKEIIIHMQAYFHQFLDKQEYNFFILKKKPSNNCPPLITSPNYGKCCGCITTI